MEKFALVLSVFLISSSAQALQSDYFQSTQYPFVVEFGMKYAHPTFGTINNVIVKNQATTSDSPTYGNVDQDYPDVFAQTIHALAVLDQKKRAIIDIKTYLPLNALSNMDTGNTYLPEYALYRAEQQRPRISAMGEMDLASNFRAGLGFDLGFGVTTEAVVFLQAGANNYSNQRVSAHVKPKLIPLLSLEWEEFRLFVQGENKVDFSLAAETHASAFPPLGASYDLTYASNSALYYQPWKFDLSRRVILDETWSLGLGVSYELWSGYVQRAATIQNISGTFSNGLNPSFKARNLFVPRIAVQTRFGSQKWELGYSFKDSIFKDVPTGSGNYLDPPRHEASLATQFAFNSGWELGIEGQVSRLSPQTVVKTDATEIGAGGYQASGWIYGGELSLTVPFESKKGSER